MALLHERLPDEHEHPTNGARVAITLVMVVAAVLGVNAWAIQKWPTKTRTADGIIVNRKWELASSGDAAGGVVAVGDSGGNFAVVGSVLAEPLGATVVNLCTYGRFGMIGARWMLDRAVSSADEPPVLALVVIGTQTLVKEPVGFNFAQIPVTLSVAAGTSVGLPYGELAEFAISRVVPLFSESVSFGNLIRFGIRPGPKPAAHGSRR